MRLIVDDATQKFFGHPQVVDGTISYMAHLNTDAWTPDAALPSASRALAHFRTTRGKTPVRAVRIGGGGVSAFDLNRVLGDGTRIGPSPDEFLRLHETGGLMVNKAEMNRLMPVANFIRDADIELLPNRIYIDSEYSTNAYGSDPALDAVRRRIFASKEACRRMEAFRPGLSKFGPGTPEFDDPEKRCLHYGAYYQHLVMTHNANVLNACGLLGPGVVVICAFTQFSSGSMGMGVYGTDMNGTPVPYTPMPRSIAGEEYASNTEVYQGGKIESAMLACWAHSCQGRVIPHIDVSPEVYRRLDILESNPWHSGDDNETIIYIDPNLWPKPWIGLPDENFQFRVAVEVAKKVKA